MEAERVTRRRGAMGQGNVRLEHLKGVVFDLAERTDEGIHLQHERVDRASGIDTTNGRASSAIHVMRSTNTISQHRTAPIAAVG